MTDFGDLDEISDIGEISADEDEADESKHSALLEGISKLGKLNKDSERRTESSSVVSEFTVGENETEKINIEQLLESLGDKRKLVGLSKKVKHVVKSNSTLPSPLTSIELVKINREIGYNAVSEELDKWNNVVRRNRVVNNITFPLKRPCVPMETGENVVKRFKPATPLENEIALLLEKKEDREKIKEEEGEPSLKPPITVDEALRWRKDAQKLRALQSYQAARARRQKKIKSKSYHRILKRERLNRQAKEFDALKESDPEQFLKKLESLDKQRILERMTLKHRGTGKWAKAQKFRARYDDDSRKALTEQLQLNRLLTMKHQVHSDEDEEEDVQERMDVNAEGPAHSNASGNEQVPSQDASRDVSVDPNKFVTVTKEIIGSSHPKITESGDFENSDNEDDQRLIIQEAFAEDDVIDQFMAEKQAFVDQSRPKEIDLSLPGWGEWGGQGIPISSQKRRRFIKPAPPGKPRRDGKLVHVIINEKPNKNLQQHVVSKVPHPYQNPEQFECAMKIPIGSTWNPETSFRKMVVPSVRTKKGSIIEPINIEVLSSAGKRKRGRRNQK